MIAHHVSRYKTTPVVTHSRTGVLTCLTSQFLQFMSLAVAPMSLRHFESCALRTFRPALVTH